MDNEIRRTSTSDYLLAIVRMITVFVALFGAFICVFLTSIVPFSYRGARGSLWVVVLSTRVFNFIFNVHVGYAGGGGLRRHKGFIFLNHMSYLEPLAILSLTPVRYLAASEVRMRPLSGWMAEQIGTIFVERENSDSRFAARSAVEKVVAVSEYPPLVIFPEGRLGAGDRINPFHPGGFYSAVKTGVPYLICAVQFNRPDVGVWKGPRGERLLSAIWRLAKSRGKIHVDFYPLDIVYPSPDDDPKQLARAARRAIAEKLNMQESVPA